ncbi:MAG: hormogonium polysaccharide biosynthesis acetyltransferase HpsU [Leptolyngbyaceae bacterium]|nr:hormogonium polysaccharide biosynthesis acetyltransferase HpsU [Leptolyngbyaceae bacterium]
MDIEANPTEAVERPVTDAPPWVDLRRYDQSHYDRGRPAWYVMLWWLVQAIAFPLTLHSSHGIRIFILRLFGANIGQGVVIRPSARFLYPWNITIGDHSWIGDDAFFYSLDAITIGSHAVVSQKSYLCTGSHDITHPEFRLQIAPITIGNGAWVATDCFVGPGVTIGANAVIGSRSSVFKDMPAGQVCLGSPCKPRYPRKVSNGEPN